ncbi:MAG: type IV secretion system DNA-binding domain-containing protein [Parvularculaceae bacterium]
MRPKQLLFLLTIAASLAAWGAHEIGFRRLPPGPLDAEGRLIARYQTEDVERCAGSRFLAMFGDRRRLVHWRGCANDLDRHGARAAFELRYSAVAVPAGLALVFLIGFLIAVRIERPPARIVRGRRYLKGGAARTALRGALAAERRRFGAGLPFPPGFILSAERETRHFLIWGSVGAGKTQTMLHLMLAALDRGDKILVLDTKGDMTAAMPEDPVLVAPQDRRSFVWSVAEDCRTKQDARELAARLIPPSADPMWSDAAREVLVACIAHLQASKSKSWTWRDLRDISLSDAERLFAIAKAVHPEAARVLADPASRTTQSILATFQAHMNTVSALADAWDDGAAPRFSIAEWLHLEGPARPVILQRDAKYPELSNAWIGGLLGLLAAAVGSPSLVESRTRRVWLFLDEFPQLPALREFSTFLDIGRSKGVIVVLGAQDIAQIRATYGRERADAWIGVVGTQVIARLNPGRGAEEASQMIGEQEVETKTRSVSYAGTRANVTEGKRRELRRTVTAAELSSRLGPRKRGVRVLLLGPGADAYEIDLPYVRLPKCRPPTLPAPWTERAPTKAAPTQANEPAATRSEVSVGPLSPAAAARIRAMRRR